MMQAATYETVDGPTRYRLKPMVVEAVRWTGERLIPFASLKQHAPDFPAHFEVDIDPTVADVKKARGIIHDADGYAILHYGDYVLLDQDGKMRACSAAMFAQVFEPYPEPENSDFQNRMIERYADKNFPGLKRGQG